MKILLSGEMLCRDKILLIDRGSARPRRHEDTKGSRSQCKSLCEVWGFVARSPFRLKALELCNINHIRIFIQVYPDNSNVQKRRCIVRICRCEDWVWGVSLGTL